MKYEDLKVVKKMIDTFQNEIPVNTKVKILLLNKKLTNIDFTILFELDDEILPCHVNLFKQHKISSVHLTLNDRQLVDTVVDKTNILFEL